MSESDCDFKSLNHVATLVGYGVEPATDTTPEKPYWLVQNSFGKGWGENGFIRLERKSTTNGVPGVCGIYTQHAAPVL